MRFLPMLIAVACVLTACAPKAVTHWQDGNFKVYAMPSDYNCTKLGYDHKPGLEGLVAPMVMAAGSNDQFVFVERANPASGHTEFYLVEKEQAKDSPPRKVEGPFSATQFRELRATRGLPDFAWRKK